MYIFPAITHLKLGCHCNKNAFRNAQSKIFGVLKDVQIHLNGIRTFLTPFRSRASFKNFFLVASQLYFKVNSIVEQNNCPIPGKHQSKLSNENVYIKVRIISIEMDHLLLNQVFCKSYLVAFLQP